MPMENFLKGELPEKGATSLFCAKSGKKSAIKMARKCNLFPVNLRHNLID